MGNKKGNKPGRIAVGKGSHDNRFILERFHRLLHTKIHSKYRIHIVILLTWNPLKWPLIGSRNLWKNCILSTIQELKVAIHILTCIWFTLQFHIFAIDQTKLHVLSVSLCCICLYTRTFSRLGFSCLLQQRPVALFLLVSWCSSIFSIKIPQPLSPNSPNISSYFRSSFSHCKTSVIFLHPKPIAFLFYI